MSGPRILIVRVGAMGDVLHGMPAVAALRAALPGAHVAWAVEPRWASLLVSGAGVSPLVDRVHPVPTREWSKAPFSVATVRSVLALRRSLRAEKYDLAIDLQGSVRSAVIARMSGADRVVGLAAPREAPATWLYTERVAVTRAHVVEQAAEVVGAAVGLTLGPVVGPLPVDDVASRWVDGLGLQTGQPLVVLAPTAGWGAKQWPAVRFGAVAKALAGRGCRVLVNASPVGVDAVANLVVACSGGAAEAVACTLPQLIALLRRASLVVAGDTGPLHLAAALGVPVVGLFGPTDPARNGPWGGVSRVLRHGSSVVDHRRHQETEAGLALIGVDEVVAAAVELLGVGRG